VVEEDGAGALYTSCPIGNLGIKMKRILLALLILLTDGIWNDAKANNTYFECNMLFAGRVDFILEEGWLGDNLYEVKRGEKTELILSDVDDYFVYYFQDKKHKNKEGGPYYINRKTGEASWGRCTTE
jgi:hypothetical protein